MTEVYELLDPPILNVIGSGGINEKSPSFGSYLKETVCNCINCSRNPFNRVPLQSGVCPQLAKGHIRR
jgi:hypothetical protein